MYIQINLERSHEQVFPISETEQKSSVKLQHVGINIG